MLKCVRAMDYDQADLSKPEMIPATFVGIHLGDRLCNRKAGRTYLHGSLGRKSGFDPIHEGYESTFVLYSVDNCDNLMFLLWSSSIVPRNSSRILV